MKMMEHLKIHVQCKRHRLLFPTESQSQSTWIISKGVLKASVQIYIKPHSLHILDFSPPWSHLFVISPLCSFKCFLKLSTQEDDRWHWVHLQPHEVVTDVAVLHHHIIEVADEDDRHKILHHHSSCHIVLRVHPRGRPPCPCLAPQLLIHLFLHLANLHGHRVDLLVSLHTSHHLYTQRPEEQVFCSLSKIISPVRDPPSYS